MRFSLKSMHVVVLLVLLVVGWLVEHVYHASRIVRLEKDVDVFTCAVRLQNAIEAARTAKGVEEYEVACDAGSDAILQLIEHGRSSRIAVCAYADAIRTPERFHSDYSLAEDASVGLSAVGTDAIPVIVALLRDDDANVRERAYNSLLIMTSQRRVSSLVAPLPKATAKDALIRVRTGLEADSRTNLKERIEDLLTRL